MTEDWVFKMFAVILMVMASFTLLGLLFGR